MMIAKFSRSQLETLEAESKLQRGSLAQILYLFKLQAELVNGLTSEEFENLNRFLVDRLHIQENTYDFNESPTLSIDEPEFLTTLDVATILGITPQMVRKRCHEGSIEAWRTMGDRGEWRIKLEPYRTHERYQDFLQQRAEQLVKKREAIDILLEISETPEYEYFAGKIESNRENDSD